MNTYPKYDPHTFQQNKLPKGLWERLAKVIYEDGYLCYHDEDGCHFVLKKIVEELHKYKIETTK